MMLFNVGIADELKSKFSLMKCTDDYLLIKGSIPKYSPDYQFRRDMYNTIKLVDKTMIGSN